MKGWQLGTQVALRRIFCGAFMCLVFKMRAPWEDSNADGKCLRREAEDEDRGERKGKRLGIQQILAELTNSCYKSWLKMLSLKWTNCMFPAKIGSLRPDRNDIPFSLVMRPPLPFMSSGEGNRQAWERRTGHHSARMEPFPTWQQVPKALSNFRKVWTFQPVGMGFILFLN